MKVMIKRVEVTIVEVADVSEVRDLREAFATGKEDVQEYCRNYGLEGSLTYTVQRVRER